MVRQAKPGIEPREVILGSGLVLGLCWSSSLTQSSLSLVQELFLLEPMYINIGIMVFQFI